MNNRLKKYREMGASGNIIVTLAIGESYFNRWEELSLSPFLEYCNMHDLGLYAIVEAIDTSTGKRNDWQKFLISAILKDYKVNPNNVCFMDYDILINPAAKNIFQSHNPEKIGFVSQRNNLPYDLSRTLKRIAFFRHHGMSKDYPLDSYLFATPKKIFSDHGLESFDDYGCGGLFLFNNNKYGDRFCDWFYLYDQNSKLISNQGEEVYLNYHIQKTNDVQWLGYEWQTLWVYEMASKYPHLYFSQDRGLQGVPPAIASSLLGCNFLHFAGAWEKWVWPYSQDIYKCISKNLYVDFGVYETLPSKGISRGQILPKDSY
jgi:hypothetical protein